MKHCPPPPWRLVVDGTPVHIVSAKTGAMVLFDLPETVARAVVIAANKTCGHGGICPRCLMPNFHRLGGGPHFDNDYVCPDCNYHEDR